MMIRNAIATPKPAVTLRSIDECASVVLIVILLRLTDGAARSFLRLQQAETQGPGPASTSMRLNRKENSARIVPNRPHDCRASLTPNSPNLHDPAFVTAKVGVGENRPTNPLF